MRIVLIDGNSLGYAAQYATKLTANEMEVQAIFGFIKTLVDVRTKYSSYVPIVLWDTKAQWRYDLYPDYKSNRRSDAKKIAIKESYERQRPHIQRALEHLGVRQVFVQGYEADDIAGHMVSSISKDPNSEIVLITGDCDWLQLVAPNVTWRDMRDDSRIVTMRNFKSYTGYDTPAQFLEAKCLVGDTSDVISGIPGIGDKGAQAFIEEFGSVYSFWENVDCGVYEPKKRKSKTATTPHPEEYLASKEGRAVFERNMKLMKLIDMPKPPENATKTVRGKLNENEFIDFCLGFNFLSIVKKIETFIRIFE